MLVSEPHSMKDKPPLAVKSFHYMEKAKFRPIHLILINPIKSYDFIKFKDFESEDVELKMLYFYEKFFIF